MKTTEEWFNQLDEAYKEKALKNMLHPTDLHYSLQGAISNGFIWEETPEGKEYWNGVFREVMYGEKFEPSLIIKPKDSVIESEIIEVENDTTEITEVEKVDQQKKVKKAKVELLEKSNQEEEEEKEPKEDLLKMFNQQKENVDNTEKTF